jgi:hypothetical protein
MESYAQNKQMPAIGYISDMEEIIHTFWLLFQHDRAASFILSEQSPLPPALSAHDLPGERSQILKAHKIRSINRHSVEIDEDSTLESILDTNNWLNWNGHFDNPNESEDDYTVHDESDIEHTNGIENPECQEQQDVCAGPNVPRLVQTIRKSTRQAEKVLVMVNAVQARRNKGVKNK